ncbi:MAG: hypothetical protein AUG80_12710 [Candidatus Rokubacteria bacterium 13_1_20CM_4_68_9]|nr:MAG: hypothetical protein AUG80_12710 [Candidatus Rokubacteria bacterium 13_1_20CM_4_68_9]
MVYAATGGNISAGGFFTAGQTVGPYYVAATQSGGKVSDTATVTITTIPVASVTVSPGSASLQVGATQQFTAVTKDAAGNTLTGRTVTWASSNTGVATVSGSGLVSGNAAGTATITGTSETQSGIAAVTVTYVPVASVTVSPGSASLVVGATQQFTAVTKDAAGNTLTGRTVTWASSNTAAATVSGSGLATGVAAGTATITATSETMSGTAVVTVTNVPVASVTVSPASATLSVGGTAQLAAVTKDAAGNTLTGRTVTWASSNTAAATVSGSGLATGVAGGTATITATSEGQSGTAAITVTAPSCVTSAGAWQNSALAAQTGAFEARFDATPNTANMDGVVGLSNGPAAAWTDLAAIVRFNATGAIDARNGGAYAAAAAIPYTAGTAYHFRLDVNLPAHTYDIYVTPAGSTERLLGGGFAFRTEQAAVSVLNNLGLYADVGSEAGCNLAVSSWTPPPVATVTVSPAAASVAVGATLPLTATLRDSAGNVLSGRSVSWTSSTPALATVAPTGFVTGVAVGAATITATSAGKSGTAALTVTLPSASNNYYVAPTGTDANPCTASAPCYTMQRVSQFLAPGDIAHFAAGNYSWSSAQGTVSASGTATARITYISDVKWGAKITGTGPCEITRNLGDYVDIVNFDMTGPCSTGLQQDANYGRVIGNRVHDLPGWGGYAGILVDCCRYIFTGNQVLGNVVDNVGPFGQTNQIHGIYVAGPNSIIENNIVTRAAAACIHLWHNSTHEIISNNVVANCGGSGIAVSADATITTADYVTVDNNIVVMNVASTAYGIYEWPAVGTHNVFNNNIVYNCPGGCMNLISGTQSGTMTLTAAQFNALFVNYTGDMTGDYHLQSGAVAIDAGTTACAAGVTTCVPGTDFDGVLRPQGRASDIGAYEWH